jgi:hypothetical protein
VLLVLLHTCLCLAVIMQMLGTPVSLWQPDFDLDPVYVSLMEGFSLLPHEMTWPPLAVAYRAPDVFPERRPVMSDDSPFRPPSLSQPAWSPAS